MGELVVWQRQIGISNGGDLNRSVHHPYNFRGGCIDEPRSMVDGGIQSVDVAPLAGG
jgi:hypothetical protein